MQYTLFDTLNTAYGATTHNNNLFEKAINAVHWDSCFEADGEMYFIKDFKNGSFTLTVENLNPFEEMWKPSVFFSDNSYAELG